jgi:hypothetical protein
MWGVILSPIFYGRAPAFTMDNEYFFRRLVLSDLTGIDAYRNGVQTAPFTLYQRI